MKEIQKTMTQNDGSIAAPRTIPMTIEEMRKVLNQEEGHSLSKEMCEVCQVEGGCIKQPVEAPKASAGPAPAPRVDGGAAGTFTYATTPNVPTQLVNGTKLEKLGEDHIAVLVSREERNILFRTMRGGIPHPAQLSTLEGALNRGVVEWNTDGHVPVGSNQVAISMSESGRQFLLAMIKRGGYCLQTPEDTAALIELEKSFAPTDIG